MGFQEDIKVPRPHGTINDTVIRVSYRVSRRYQSPPGPTEQLTIQSLGFLIGFLIGIQEDIKVIRPHETIDHIETRFFFRVSRRYQNHHHHHHHLHHHHHHHYHHRRHLHHLGLPGRSSRVRANLRGLP